jgi:hypothetical protein
MALNDQRWKNLAQKAQTLIECRWGDLLTHRDWLETLNAVRVDNQRGSSDTCGSLLSASTRFNSA